MWVVSGIIGAYTRDLYSFFAKEIGLAKFYIWRVGASLLIPKAQTETFWGNILGFLVDAVVGGLFGVIIGLLLEWRGTRNYIIKGMGVGLLAWMFFYGILFHNLPFTLTSAPNDPLSNISAFIGHSIFGIAAVMVYVKFLSRKFVESSNPDNSDHVQDNKHNPRRFKLIPQPSKNRLKKPIKL